MAPRLDFDPSGDFGQYGSQPSGDNRVDFDPSGDFGQYGWQPSGTDRVDYNPASDFGVYSFRQMGQFPHMPSMPPPGASSAYRGGFVPPPPPPPGAYSQSSQSIKAVPSKAQGYAVPAGVALTQPISKQMTFGQILQNMGLSDRKSLSSLYNTLVSRGGRFYMPNAPSFDAIMAKVAYLHPDVANYLAPITAAEKSALAAAVSAIRVVSPRALPPALPPMPLPRPATVPVTNKLGQFSMSDLTRYAQQAGAAAQQAVQSVTGGGSKAAPAPAPTPTPTPAPAPIVMTPAPTPPVVVEEKKDNTMKIALAVGAVGVVGFLVYKQSQK